MLSQLPVAQEHPQQPSSPPPPPSPTQAAISSPPPPSNATLPKHQQDIMRANSGQLNELINKYIETPKKQQHKQQQNDTTTDEQSAEMRKQRSEYTFESLFFKKDKKQ